MKISMDNRIGSSQTVHRYRRGSEMRKENTIKVKAISIGYYGGQLREVGEEFSIRHMDHFSSSWMEKVK